jgi:hypothetical protein
MNGTLARYDLFLSHNRRQKPWVRQLVTFLRSRGLRVFFDEDSIAPGEDVVAALERAIEASDALILVLSRSSVFSKWVAFETAQKLYEDPDSHLSRLIPVLVEPVDRTLIRPSVRRLDAVDLTDPETREFEFLHFLQSIGITDAARESFPPWPETSLIDELHIADIDGVTSWGWSGVELLRKLIALDYEIFDNLTPDHEGNPEQWAPVFMDHPETWRLLVTPSNAVVGYWHFVPLFAEEFELAANGNLLDSGVTTNKVRVFEFPGSYSAYFVTFGLRAQYRRTKGFKLLMHSFFDVLQSLAKDGIYIAEVCANAYTDSGIALCKTFGMNASCTHSERGTIFRAQMEGILASEACSDYAELRRLYANRPSRAVPE